MSCDSLNECKRVCNLTYNEDLDSITHNKVVEFNKDTLYGGGH